MMIVYVLIILLPVLINFITKNNKKAFAIFVFLEIFIFVGFRSISVGADTQQYLNIFSQIDKCSLVEYLNIRHNELFFVVFTKAIAELSGSFRVYLIICGMIFSATITFFIYKQAKEQWYSWFFVIAMSTLVYAFSGIRSSFGLIFGMLAIQQVFDPVYKSKKYHLLKHAVYLLIAVLFHYTAFVFAILYPIYLIKRKKYYPLFYVIACLMVIVFIPILLPILNSVFFPLKEYDFSSSGGMGLLLIVFIMRLYICVFVKNEDKDEEYRRASFFLEITFLIQLSALYFSLMSRISQFVFTIAIVYYPNILLKTRIKQKRIQNVAVCFILLMYYIYELANKSNGLLPYSFM